MPEEEEARLHYETGQTHWSRQITVDANGLQDEKKEAKERERERESSGYPSFSCTWILRRRHRGVRSRERERERKMHSILPCTVFPFSSSSSSPACRLYLGRRGRGKKKRRGERAWRKEEKAREREDTLLCKWLVWVVIFLSVWECVCLFAFVTCNCNCKCTGKRKGNECTLRTNGSVCFWPERKTHTRRRWKRRRMRRRQYLVIDVRKSTRRSTFSLASPKVQVNTCTSDERGRGEKKKYKFYVKWNEQDISTVHKLTVTDAVKGKQIYRGERERESKKCIHSETAQWLLIWWALSAKWIPSLRLVSLIFG